MITRVCGIRHHGPGSARATVAALAEFRPDAVLIEGPADADAIIPLARDDELQPPVALMAYAVDDPGLAAFWPLAVFSPEWQALRWALDAGVVVRFCDLPAAQVLAARDEPAEKPDLFSSALHSSAALVADRVRQDPIALLADAAGYDDPERWWDDVVEHRRGEQDAFDAITDAMRDLRAHRPDADRDERRELRREAHMRSVLRAAGRAGAERIAVVCGAWHAPALTAPLPAATADARLLRGAPKRKVALTWVPWTHSRLAFASGYGAGVDSPGWYHHLFTTPDEPVTRWLTRVAGVLRKADLPASSAHVIEAVRLAQTLAALRERPLAGLSELTDATRAVLCAGDESALALVTRDLVVGEALGTVPASTPTVPLAADLRAQSRRLRLRREPSAHALDLDLRSDYDRDRSRLLHRLRLIGITWGEPAQGRARNLGTFRETWSLRWDPGYEVDLVVAAMWGATVADAAAAKLVSGLPGASLRELTSRVEQCLFADLTGALPALLTAVDARAAADGDIADLMAAVAPLARSVRYGDVRGTDRGGLATVTEHLLARVRAALPAAVTNLDDEGAATLRRSIDEVHQAVGLLDAAAAAAWLDALTPLADRIGVNGLLTGRFVRLLHDAGRMDAAGVAVRLSRALSRGTPPPVQAGWVDGFFTGGGLLLLHDPDLLALLDMWVSGLDASTFVDVLPLVRRTFGAYPPGERRQLGERIRRGATAPASAVATNLDPVRGHAVARAVTVLLGGAP